MKWLVNTLVALVGLLFAALWLGWMVDPAGMSARWELSALSVFGSNNLRGDIGGLFLGIAAFCGLYFVGGTMWLRAAAVVLTCVLLGRWVGIAIEGYHPQSMLNAVIEAVLLLVFMGAMKFGGRGGP